MLTISCNCGYSTPHGRCLAGKDWGAPTERARLYRPRVAADRGLRLEVLSNRREHRRKHPRRNPEAALISKITRRRFLRAVAAGGAWIALIGTLGCERSPRARAIASPAGGEQPWAFRSRPDLRPPTIEVRTQAHGTAPGYIFVSPKKEPGASGPSEDAPLIVDDGGEPVWFHPLQGDAERDAFNFEVQFYKGETVLTWWEGHHTGFGQGEYVICDHSYREITRVRAGNGYEGDHHEFLITPQDTALITIYS